jgi:hypothetical protein
MKTWKDVIGLLALAMLAGGVSAQDTARVFELRTYHCFPGKLETLKTRFREHTTKIFEKHGMTNVGYWTFQDEPDKSNTLIYMISHASREQAKKNWAEFSADPEWQKVQKDSEANGKIVQKVDSQFLDAADFSPLK